jgi:hypothetical protein
MVALRAVEDGERPKRPRRPAGAGKRVSIAVEARSNDRRRVLVSLRDDIAARLDQGVAARDLASLSKRLMDLVNEIAEIDAAVEGDDVSDAAATPDEVWDPTAS